jgi:hypothetical protein
MAFLYPCHWDIHRYSCAFDTVARLALLLILLADEMQSGSNTPMEGDVAMAGKRDG